MWSGRAAGHSTLSSAEVMEEWSYSSTLHLGHTGPVTGLLYLHSLICQKTYDGCETPNVKIVRYIIVTLRFGLLIY
jgi:hypothetical protein